MKTRMVAVLVALAAVTALGACASAPPTPSPVPSASTSPTPSPAPEPVAASVAITAETISVLDADGGVLASFDYFQPTTEVVAGLTEYLGEPVDTPNPGSIESSPGVDHEWGGLRLYDTDTPGTPPEIPNHSVFVTGPTAGPLPIGTAAGVGAPSGLHVGDPGTSVTVGIESAGEYTNPTTGRTVVLSRVGLIELPPHPAAPTEPRNFAVIVHSYTDTGLIEQLIAPSANFGV